MAVRAIVRNDLRMSAVGHRDPGLFACRGCGSLSTTLVLDLGDLPASDMFPPVEDTGPDPGWPLCLYFCHTCALVQLGPADHPDPEVPRAVESATGLEHASQSAGEVFRVEGLRPGQAVIEIDSHHGGSWLDGFAAAGLITRGPAEQADLVVDVHGLAHEPFLEAPLAAHARRLLPGGRLVLEFHHLLPLVEEGQVDTIRHGHFVYLSLLAMRELLTRHGLVVTRALAIPMFGGSLRLTARHADEEPEINVGVAVLLDRERAAGLDGVEVFEAFAERGRAVASAFRDHLQQLHAAGKRVAGYGAPSKAPVLVGLAGVDERLLPYTVDLAAAKHGRRLPGTAIPILAPDRLLDDRPDEVVILTWDIASEIVEQLTSAAEGSGWSPAFYVALPAAGYIQV